MSRWVFREIPPGERCVVVQADRWFDARTAARAELGTDALNDKPLKRFGSFPGVLYLVVTWEGSDAGDHPTLRMIVQEPAPLPGTGLEAFAQPSQGSGRRRRARGTR